MHDKGKELVSLLKDEYCENSYHKIMSFLDGKLAKVKDTVVMETETWNRVMHALKVHDAVLDDLMLRTPVNSAQGVCMQFGCQWNQHVEQRQKNEERKKYYVELCSIVESSMKLLIDLREKKLVIAEEWWDQAVTRLNQRLQDIRSKLLID